MTLQEILKIDCKVSGFKTGGLYRLRNWLFPNYAMSYIITLRKYSYYKRQNNIIFFIYAKILKSRLYHLAGKTGFYIPEDVFGPGIYIPHIGSVIVNPNAKIGAYCLINSNVVIGQENGKCPIIGDNCFIGSGAVICGDIKIGNNVWVGANSVVTKSFDVDNVLIAGVPAKIIAKRDKNWVQSFNLL